MPISMSPYLTFNGDCAQAMQFYQKTLGGKLDMMKYKDAPPSPDINPKDGERILHARLAFDGGSLMSSDIPSSMKYEGMQSMSVAASFPNAADAKKAFDAFANGGKVTAPLTSTFFAEAFAMVTDRFGTPWILTGGQRPGM